MIEGESHKQLTPEFSEKRQEKRKYHPVVVGAWTKFINSNSDYLNGVIEGSTETRLQKFERILEEEFQILSICVKHILSEYGDNAMMYLKMGHMMHLKIEHKHKIEGKNNEEILERILLEQYFDYFLREYKRKYSNVGERDKSQNQESQRENNVSDDGIRFTFRYSFVQVIRQGYFAFLKKNLLQDPHNEDFSIIYKELNNRGFYEDWWFYVPYTLLYKIDLELKKLLEAEDFPIDRVRLLFIDTKGGYIKGPFYDEREIKEYFKGLVLSPQIRHLKIPISFHILSSIAEESAEWIQRQSGDNTKDSSYFREESILDIFISLINNSNLQTLEFLPHSTTLREEKETKEKGKIIFNNLSGKILNCNGEPVNIYGGYRKYL